MTLTFANLVAMTGIILLGAALSSKISRRFNLPILLAFMLFGVLLKWDGSGRYEIPPAILSYLGTIAMSFILFSGGLSTRYSAIKSVLGPGVVLATFGVLCTALLLGAGAWWIFRIPWVEGDYPLAWCFLLGAMISSTDASAVFGILRGKGVGLPGKLRDLLEFESGSNDPMAYCLTILFLAVAQKSGLSPVGMILQLVWAVGAGALIGWGIGILGKWIFHFEVEYEGLYFVFIVALVLACYGIAEVFKANGLMACYVAGVTMNHLRFNYQRNSSRFCDGVNWLLQVALFVALGYTAGGDLDLLQARIWVPGILISLVLMFIARPLAVFCSLLFWRYPVAQKLLISWVGLRGAAPIVLSTFPLAAGLPNAEVMANMVFFMVITSILVQGTTIMPVARYLKQERHVDERVRLPLELERTRATSGSDMFEFEVSPQSELVGKSLAEIGFPEGVLVTMIRRGEALISPRGNTRIAAGDGLLIMAGKAELRRLAHRYFPDAEY